MIEFIRVLNKPYRRIDLVIEGFCMIIDGIVYIISFGYLRTNLQMWKIDRNLDRMSSYVNNKIEDTGE
uniref:Uncharacterized protein n=1 Tax=viral metagenome TaxID=1070528 RepID=A0A6M3X4D7_9ZZZZ